MARVTHYHPGGGVRSDEWDSSNGYTRWDAGGAVAEQRALTGPEVAMLSARDAADAQVANEAALREQALAALANLRTIRDAPQVSVGSVANAQTVCRQLQSAVQAEAAVLIRLARLLLDLRDGTD